MQVSAKVESEIAKIESEVEKKEFLEAIGIKESAINILTRLCIKALNLISFFTVGADEVRQWTIKTGSSAPEAAGAIHTDMQRGFIRAEVMKYSDLIELGDEKKVKEIASKRQLLKREKNLREVKHLTLADLHTQIQEGKIKELPIIIKGDTHGSVEALSDSLMQITSDKVRLKIIHAGMGAVNESDVMLASASNAIILGFHVKTPPEALELAETEKVDIHFYNIIYEAISEVKKALEGLLEPEYKKVILGSAEVRQVFHISKKGTVAGSHVIKGKIGRNCKITLLREEKSIYEGNIETLRRFKDDVKEVESGYECGISLTDFDDIQEGDIIEAYILEELERKL